MWLFLFIEIIFSILQITVVQNKLINLFLQEDVNIELVGSSGVFPFNFSVKKINIKSKDFKVLALNVAIKINTNLTDVQNLKIEELKIDSSSKSGSSFSDIEKIMPIISQDFVKDIVVDKIVFKSSEIKNVSLAANKDLNEKILKLNTSKVEISSKIILKNDDFSAKVDWENKKLHIAYNLKNKNILFDFVSDSEKICSFNGTLKDGYLKGLVNIKDTRINGSFRLQEDYVNAELSSELFKASSNMRYNTTDCSLFVDKLTFDDWAAFKPFVISPERKIDNIDVLLKNGKINFKNINLSDGNFSLGTAKFENIDISQFQKNQEKVKGVLSGHGHYKNGIEEFDLQLKNLEFENMKSPPVLISGKYFKDKIDIKILYKILNKENKLDLSIKASNWIIDGNSSVKLKAKGIFNIGDHFKFYGQTLKGKLSYLLSAAGTIADPVFSGNVDLKNVIYANPSFGTYVKNCNINVAIKNNKISINKIHAVDDSKRPGFIDGSGKVTLNKDKALVDISLNFNDFEIVEFRELEGRLFGKINISGDLLKQLNINGDLYTEKAVLNVSNFIARSSHAIEIVEKKKKSKPKLKVHHDSFAIKCPVDIKFFFKPSLHIKGSGPGFVIDSMWNGGGSLTGDISNLIYDEKVTLKSGKAQVSGKILQLKDGEILSNSEKPGVFIAKLSAVKILENIIVEAKFSQNEKGNNVEFSSNPHVSDKDVLSYFLFEKPSVDLSAGEAIILFSRMGKVFGSGGEGGFDILEKIQMVIGIDSIEMKRNKDKLGEEYDAISIGKSLGKVKVSVDQGVGQDTTKVVVEAKVMKDTKVSVDLSGTGDSAGAGVVWSKRY